MNGQDPTTWVDVVAAFGPSAIAVATIVTVLLTLRSNRNNANKDRQLAQETLEHTLADARAARATQLATDQAARLESHRLTAVMDFVRLTRECSNQLSKVAFGPADATIDYPAQQLTDAMIRLELLCETDISTAAIATADVLDDLMIASMNFDTSNGKMSTDAYNELTAKQRKLKDAITTFVAAGRIEMRITPRTE